MRVSEIQFVACPCDGHVEQAPFFLERARVARLREVLAARRLDGFFHRPVAALAQKADRGHTELRQNLLQ